jgi:hypothetical protein
LIRRSERRRSGRRTQIYQQLGEETSVGQLFALSRVGDLDEPRSHGGQSQGPAGLVDAGVGGLVGHATPIR